MKYNDPRWEIVENLFYDFLESIVCWKQKVQLCWKHHQWGFLIIGSASSGNFQLPLMPKIATEG